jgi:hypothetical protein
LSSHNVAEKPRYRFRGRWARRMEMATDEVNNKPQQQALFDGKAYEGPSRRTGLVVEQLERIGLRLIDLGRGPEPPDDCQLVLFDRDLYKLPAYRMEDEDLATVTEIGRDLMAIARYLKAG